MDRPTARRPPAGPPATPTATGPDAADVRIGPQEWALSWEASAAAGRPLRATFTRVTFTGLDLTELATHGSVFDACHFSDVRLSASTHRESAFLSCTFVGCTLFGASFSGCKAVGSTFERCTFGALEVDRGDWSFVTLARADLSGVRVLGTRLREADLTGAQCHRAVLRDADLSGASLEAASFRDADLRGSDLSALDPRVTDVRGAVVDLRQAVVLAENLGLDVRAD